MQERRLVRLSLFLVAAALLLPVASYPQASQGSVSGTVLDPSGAVVPDAELVLTYLATGAKAHAVSGPLGHYSFPNLTPGSYLMQVNSPGFKIHVQSGIELTLGDDIRITVRLALGSQQEQIEVIGASPMNYDSGSREGGIAPGTLDRLPLLVSGAVRSAAGFAILMPGVTTGGGADPFDARINGGMVSGDEAVLDGISMQQGFMSQSGMISLFLDFPFSPDMVSEVKVVSSSYAPEYGASTSGQLVAVTKSGTDRFHGAVFEHYRNDSLNATQWGQDEKPENRQHNFGANIGGPLKIPAFWSDSVKSYFYVNVEGFRQDGGVNAPTLSIPSMLQRNGDFSDWRDAEGNLIPIYDPATTRIVNGVVVRDPFPGNIIPRDRWNPQAQEWLQFLPTPTREGPLNNYTAPPIPDTILGDSNYFFGRFDTYIGQNDHFSVSIWHQRAPLKIFSSLPQQIANESTSDPQNSWVNRINWDHTFSPTLLNHMAFGYLNRNEGYGGVNDEFVNILPQIQGVALHNVPPQLEFSDGFEGWGNSNGRNPFNVTTRPTYVLNDTLTWVKGSHTVRGGFEYRNIGGNIHNDFGQSGNFFFDRGATGLQDINSGSPIASFLLGAVDNADVNFWDVTDAFPRQKAFIFHLGDTWRATDKLTLNYGLRWDYFSPSLEKFNTFSFFDPVGANPAAGGLPGRLAFAGTEFGEASFGAPYPEDRWYGGFAPRVGFTYALGDTTLLRAGWGIFYDRAFYPGWGGGIGQDGFSSNVAFGSSLAGLEPAFLLQNGFPQDFIPPPFINSGFRNGQSPGVYRPQDANERPRSQQWNLTVDQELRPGLTLGLAYVGSRGRRYPSNNQALNALDPALLSMGQVLNLEFDSDTPEIAGVPQPYAGWADQMQGCPPSVAQALLPFPQYCGNIQGLNENHGESIYHSFQAKLEQRFTGGTYFLVSYTLGRIHTSGTDNVQREALTWSGASGVISPFEQDRNRALATDDVTHLLSAALIWDIPFAEGSTGAKEALLDGWSVSAIFRYSTGTPFFFRSGFCNVPGQFRAACIPTATGDPFAQDIGSFDPGQGPLFNAAAFGSTEQFNFNFGTGPRVTTLRGQSYHNLDMTLIKNTQIGGLNLQLRIAAFNILNAHSFTGTRSFGNSPFDTDVASPDFGQWTGTVSNPRNVQLAIRLQF